MNKVLMVFMSVFVFQTIFSEDIHRQEQDLQGYLQERLIASVVYTKLSAEKEKELQGKSKTLRQECLNSGECNASPSEIERITKKVKEECILAAFNRQEEASKVVGQKLQQDVPKKCNLSLYWNRTIVEASVVAVLARTDYLKNIIQEASAEKETQVDPEFIKEVCKEIEFRYKASTIGMFFGFLNAAQKDIGDFFKKSV